MLFIMASKGLRKRTSRDRTRLVQVNQAGRLSGLPESENWLLLIEAPRMKDPETLGGRAKRDLGGFHYLFGAPRGVSPETRLQKRNNGRGKPVCCGT